MIYSTLEALSSGDKKSLIVLGERELYYASLELPKQEKH